MEPSTAKVTSIRKNGSILKFCSEKCKVLLTKEPSEINVFAHSTENDRALLNVTGVVALKDVDSIYPSSASYVSAKLLAECLDQTLDEKNNTVVSMLICCRNQSDSDKRPFVLCALRSLNASRLVDFYVNSDFIPLDGRSYMGHVDDNNIIDYLRETRLTQKIIQKLENKDLSSYLQVQKHSETESNFWNEDAVYIGLPSNFQVRYPTRGFDCIQLPKHHQLLLHSPDTGIPGQNRVFLLCFGESYYDQLQEHPYIVSIRLIYNKFSHDIISKDVLGYLSLLADGVIISRDGKNEVLSTLVETLGSLSKLTSQRGQQMVDSVLPGMFEQAGCRNIMALIYRATCER